MFKNKIFSSIFLGLLISAIAGCGKGEDKTVTPPVRPKIAVSARLGDAPRVPQFRLNDLDGNPFDSDQLNGKVRVINFWATWCIYCKIEIPDLNRLYDRYNSQGLEIVGISLDQNGPGTVKRFMQSHPIEYKVLMGNQQVSQSFGGIVGLPTTFIVDRNGEVVRSFPGFVKVDIIENIVRTLL
ncbi:MAG: TlpA disulfide reductase family protein [bacterium]